MDRLGMDLKFVGMVVKQHAHSPQGIDIEMQQVVIVTRNGMVSDHCETHVLVDEGEELVHILLQILERVPDVHLRNVFAVRRRVLELESLSVSVVWGIVDQTVAIAMAAGVDNARTIAPGSF
jgi:uncharacterized protein with HEPN domain